MRSEYTVQKTIAYQIRVMAEDDDDALEKALSVSFENWDKIETLAEIIDEEPIEKGASHVDY